MSHPTENGLIQAQSTNGVMVGPQLIAGDELCHQTYTLLFH